MGSLSPERALDGPRPRCENGPSVGDPSQYQPGQQLAGTVYRVVRHLATGGMGSVYDVEDVTVGKRYVLKTLHPQLVSRHDLAKRMEAEARTLAKLQHPNIVDVVTAGVTTDEQRMPFYVMERLNGQNLRVVIEKKGSLELTHCFRIAIDVLDALEQAHENSVIHRDVKPENIFLHRNANGTTTTKLLDFGIMRLLDRKASHTHGKFIGTLRYASPEQIFGGELGPATDIYSLGIVLYEMLAGRGPFDDVGDAYAIGAAHAQRPPPPISQFAAVPPALERLVMTALAKSPNERPRDCFSFASELRRMLRQEEAAPKSATAVNVLSSAPPNTRAGLPLAGTEASPPHSSAPEALGSPGSRTDLGMLPPSIAGAPAGASAGAMGGALPPTVRHGAGGHGASGHGSGGYGAAGPGAGPIVMPNAATDIAVAATLASNPGGDVGRAFAAAARGGSIPGAKPLVDRAAETRASSGFGATQRLAQNGTAVDDGTGGMLADDAVRAALGQRELLELPPTSAQPHDPRNHEIVFPKAHGLASGTGGTGPFAGEASTRPPERGILLPLLAAAAFGALLVGGAVLYVVAPWNKHRAPPATTAAAEVATTPAMTTSPATPAATPALAPTAPTTNAPSVAPALASATAVLRPAPGPAVAPSPGTRAPAATPRTSGPAATPAVTASPSASPAPTSGGGARKPARPAASGAPKPEEIKFD